MRTIFTFVLLLFITIQSAVGQGELITNQSVIELQQAGFSETIIMHKIKVGPTYFDVSVPALKRLKEAGVSESIISYMMEVVEKKSESVNPPKENLPPSKPVEQPVQPQSNQTVPQKPNTAKTEILIPQPEFMNVVQGYDSLTGRLFDLEKVNFRQNVRINSSISSESYAYIQGASSTVNFKNGKLPLFIVRTSPGTDPASFISLTPLWVNKSTMQREIILSSNTLGGNGFATDNIPINFKKVGDDLYSIQTAAPVGVGEFAFRNNSTLGYAFSVSGETSLTPGSNVSNVNVGGHQQKVDDYRCASFTTMKRAGIAFTVLGSLALVGGAILAAATQPRITNNGTLGGSVAGHTAGVIMIGPGVGFLVVGVPLLAVGKHKTKQLCQ